MGGRGRSQGSLPGRHDGRRRLGCVPVGWIGIESGLLCPGGIESSARTALRGFGGRRSMRWLSGWIRRTGERRREAGLNLNVQVSIDASITRPELRQVGEQQKCWGDLEP